MLFYADDTVIFGTKNDFQNNFDMFFEYLELCHLASKFDKTKVMIFGIRQGCHKIDNCIDFKYIGVIFSKTRHSHQTRNQNVEQAWKAKHVLLNKLKIVIFQLIMQLYLICIIIAVVAYGALKIAKLLKVYMMLFSYRLLV